ncbi:MAG: amidohydrolase family protein [Reyranella sp.]|jgi:N-acyl-D-aspartate/D-glutamate deacylase|nr:amidohydrolase family protein [Reyranella sp.]MBL6654285.1 amidohydrolase family protein [Reyranella sp.]
MSQASSLVIRGGTIVDGTGRKPFVGDVAVVDGKIVEVGTVTIKADQEIDAKGLLVTPGFVDIHTHYDAQAIWSNRLDPSSWNGVTTVMMSNCGVGFAPCKPHEREVLVALMEGVEDIPEVVMTEGLPWNWETFPDFMNRLGERQYDVDIVTQVPHAAIRVYVMGQRGADREPATDEDRREMARLVAEGIEAGALGFSTSNAIAHKTLAGKPTPTLASAEEELAVIAEAVGKTGKGWVQIITDFDDPVEELTRLRRVAARSGRPMSLTLAQREGKPGHWKLLLDMIEDANKDGVKLLAQIMGRQIGINFGFEISLNPFCERPSYKAIANLPFEERLQRLQDPAVRAAILAEKTPDASLERRLNTWDRIFELGTPPNYEPPLEASMAARAKAAGVPVEEFVYDLLLKDGGTTILFRPVTNYVDGNLDACLEMMKHPNTVMGLGDGGAHYSFICDSSTTTYTITHWTRDRTRGEKMPIEWVVKRLSSDPARTIGLNDRGVIAPGYKADLNVIDYNRLNVGPLHVVYDLPAGGRRLNQRTEGYVATILSGTPVYREGEATGALPGRLVRGPQEPDQQSGQQLAAE